MADIATAALAPAEPGMEKTDNASAVDVQAEILRRLSKPPEAEAGDTNATTTDPEAEAAPETEAETPEAQTEAASEEQPAAEEEAPDEVLSKLPDHVQQRVNKRIGKLTARAKQAEEARAALEAEKSTLATAKAELEAKLQALATQPPPAAPVVLPTDDDPLADIQTPDALEKKRQQARAVKRAIVEALEDNPDAEELQIGGQTIERARAKEIRRTAERELEEHIPARERWLQARTASYQRAVTDFPWMADPNSPEIKEAAALIRQRPHLARDPDIVYLVGQFVEGAKLLRAKAEAAKKPATPPKVAAKPPPVAETAVVPPRKPTGTAAAVAKDADYRTKVASANASSDEVMNVLLRKELAKARA